MAKSCQRLWEPAERLKLARHVAAAARDRVERGPSFGSTSRFHYRLINMHIRQERPEDAATIRVLTDAAFKGMPYSNQTEAKIIDALRAAGALTISLVAIQDGETVGHVAFSPVRIDGAAGDWYGLGPVSVRPDHQQRGIGQALIRDGLHRLQSMSAAGCVLLGDPAYYGRVGFESDPDLYYGDVPPGYFQRLTLNGSPPKGEVSFHPGFDVS